ncbi:MAG: RNA 2',3'-cyclic phosphodiesterase, partial [Planctomycetales bacterium]
KAAKLTTKLNAAGANVRWVAEDSLHLTLNFLGEVDLRQTPEICGVVADTVAELDPFSFQASGAGAFPNVNRPRTVWIGVSEGAEDLKDVYDQLEKALSIYRVGRDRQRFVPHVTIGRVRGNSCLPELGETISAQAEFPLGVAPVTNITVFSSELRSSGPIYTVLSHARLGG